MAGGRRGSYDRAKRDRLIEASLSGSARRHVDDHSEPEAAVAELVKIATVDGRLRTDLLEHAAGAELGGWLHSSVSAWAGRSVALLLVRAGADPDRVKEIAEETRARLDHDSRPGIGNPGSR